DGVGLAFSPWLEHAAALPLLVQAGFELGGVVAGGERLGHGLRLLVLLPLLLLVIPACAGMTKSARPASRTHRTSLTCRTSSTPVRAPGSASSARAAGRARTRRRGRLPARARSCRRPPRRAG